MARHRFFYLLNLARHRVHKHTDRRAQEVLGVSSAQLGALFVVEDRPGLSQREIARALGFNDSAVTALMRRLLTAGLVERTPSPDDGRASEIRLTKRGAKVTAEGRPLLAEFNRILMEGFDETELDVAARFLSQAVERFGPEGS